VPAHFGRLEQKGDRRIRAQHVQFERLDLPCKPVEPTG
jgi:hypothetical protein